MKISILIPFLLTVCPLICSAAFSNVESEQLSTINNKSKDELNKSIVELNEAIDSQIKNNTEKKDIIIELKELWEKTLTKKCELESFDSQGTDAEIAEKNDCLVKAYQKETTYFNNLLP